MADSGMDISKLVGLIMENPDIIERIRGLVDTERDDESDKADGDASEDVSLVREDSAISADAPSAEESAGDNEAVSAAARARSITKQRHDLLCALKPYVSKKRASAIDTALGIMDVIAVMKK